MHTHEGGVGENVGTWSKGCQVSNTTGIIKVQNGLINDSATVYDFKPSHANAATARARSIQEAPMYAGAQTHVMNSFVGQETVSLTIINKSTVNTHYNALDSVLGKSQSDSRRQSYGQ